MNLLPHLVESTLFAAAVWLATLLLRHNHARARHALWLAASIKFLLPFSLLITLGSNLVPHHSHPLPPPQMRFVMVEPAPPVPYSAIAAPLAPTQSRLPLFWLLWFAGSSAILLRWSHRWRAAARVRRESTPYAADLPIPVRTSASALEPAIYGIFRPVLVLPANIETRLSRAHLDTIYAHELCHVRHRDNLAAAVHMLVEALFWFHPLVWWIGARLVDERERACDEEVLRLGSDRAIYAESILRVCAFALESPLPCVSGISGADLKQRIRHVMSGAVRPQLPAAKKLLLAALAAAALAVPLAIGLTHPPNLRAQAPQTAAPLKFDAASVKVSDQQFLQIFPQRSGGNIQWTTDLGAFIAYAYHLESWRMSGPIPGHEHVYTVKAVTDPKASEDQVRLMFQSLLIDRFQMAVHRETREVDGYALTVLKGGFKLPEAKGIPDDLPASLHGEAPAGLEGKVLTMIPQGGQISLIGRRVTMVQFAAGLQRVLKAMVADHTGIAGNYYFALDFAQLDHPADLDLPDLFTALQPLGLKLEKYRGPVEMLVVDRIEKAPTEN